MNTFSKRRTIAVYGGLLLAATATAALAGSGVGGVFNLGQINSVNGSTELRGTTSTQQLMVRNSSTANSSAAVVGLSVRGTGVWGRSSRVGVRGSASATTGTTYGIYATTASPDGLAGFFQNTNAPDDFNGTALVAVSRGATAVIPNTYADPAGAFVGYNGVLGTTSPGSDTGFGVIGDTAGTFGTGVRAAARSTTGTNYGIWATAESEDGLAGYFQNSNASSSFTGTALRAISEGSASDLPSSYSAAGEFVGRVGVIAVATPSLSNGTGVAGYARGESGIGVIGAGSYLGVYSDGNAIVEGDLQVTGTITKGTNNFKIDHPLDSANKYLSHSVVESPDMMNIYNGNVVTDADGVAVVELPDYFEALNRDPRYQLTVIGSFAAAQIAQKVEDNSFVIRTSEPGVEVSWQVTGIRQDAFAEAHPIMVEEEKALADRGRYLHPVELGQPKTMAIGIGTHVAAQAGPEAPRVQ